MNAKLHAAVVVCLAVALSACMSWGATVAEQVRELREQQKDYTAAEALAEDFLRAHPQLDLERQQVQFELGRAQYAAKDYTTAAATLRDLVGDYSNTALDKAAEGFVVDDAQFYVGVIEHYFGDRAKGIEGYEKAIADFPKSNRRPLALMLLAGVHEQDGDKAKALARFQQLVAEHPTSAQAPEAELHVGHLLRDEGKLDEAIAAFQRVATDWPDSKHAATGLLNANRALMAEEISSVEAAREDNDRIVENEKPIQANVKVLLEKYGDSDELPQVMQDLINYYSNPCHARRDPQAREKVGAFVSWLRENRPGTPQGLRAICEHAVMLGPDHSEAAIAELDWLIEIARTGDDESLLFDAQFAKAQVLLRTGDKEQARDIWTGLLEVASDEHLADEIRIMIILTKPVKEGVAAFEEMAEDESRHSDIRGMAMLFLASYHKGEGRYEEALVLVEKVIADFPETLNAGTAKKRRAVLLDLVKVPIENRGNYRPQ